MIFGWLAYEGRRAKFPLYHTPAILSREILHKIADYFFPIIVQYYHLQSAYRCVILSLSRGRDKGKVPIRCHKAISQENSLKIPLDKLHMMWYNKGVKRKGERPHQIRLTITHWLVNANAANKNRQFCKFPLDNHHKVWYNTDVP